MATTVTKTIKPSGQGGNYTSLAAWEAQNIDCVATDTVQIAQPAGDWSAVHDTAAVTLAGWTTDATRNITIEPDAANRASAAWDDEKYVLSVTNAVAINLAANITSLKIVGLQIELNSTATLTRAIACTGVNIIVTDLLVDSCVVKGTLTAGAQLSGVVMVSTSANQNFTCRNSVFFNFPTTPACYAFYTGYGTSNILNCTVNNAIINRYQGTITVKNCIANGRTDNYEGTFAASSTNNCSDITSDAPGSNPITGTVLFVDAANGNFNLLRNTDNTPANPALGAGANLSSDFTTDINGVTRPASGAWDLGAAQYVSSALPEVTGSLSATLAAVTLSSSGSVSVSGSLSKTLNALTLAASGSLSVSGGLSTTLAPVGLSSAGSVSIGGVLSQALAPVTLVSAGSLSVSGSLTKTLDLVTVSSTGSLSVLGSAAITLGAVTLTATGRVGADETVIGSLNITLEGVRLSATAYGVSIGFGASMIIIDLKSSRLSLTSRQTVQRMTSNPSVVYV